MTYEEAKNIICVLKSRISNPKNIEAFEIAITAIKKEIPQKVNVINCPICKERLINYLDRIYCPYCGQKLDWEEAE